MFYYVSGTVAHVEPYLAVIDCGGVGYACKTTSTTISQLQVGKASKLYTYLHVGEGIFDLYGFATQGELGSFKQLIGVSGVGPKAALAILSVMTTDDLRFAVLGDDEKTIAKAPGIGAKTAKRLILELKDKLKLEDAFESALEHNGESGSAPGQGTNAVKNEAVQALTALGYSSSEALKALQNVEITDGMDVETVLKQALKQMAFL